MLAARTGPARLMAFIPLLTSSLALAQEPQQSGLDVFLHWLPILIFVALWFLVSQLKQQKELMAHQREHFARVETQLAELNQSVKRLSEPKL
jgi:hypothetical protein